jgi:hypothetical protein
MKNKLFGQKDDLDFDLVDDVVFFINNDDIFYRKHAYPIIHTFEKKYKQGKKLSPKVFSNLAVQAYKQYQLKHPTNGLPDTLSNEHIENICNSLYKQERDHIENPGNDLSESINTICKRIDKLWTTLHN